MLVRGRSVRSTLALLALVGPLLSSSVAAASAPTVTITPATGLHAGQRVAVSASGFTPEAKLSLTECTSKDQVRPGPGCSDGTEGAVALVVGSEGRGLVGYTVVRTVGDVTCRDQCVVEASFGDETAYAPISFESKHLPLTGAVVRRMALAIAVLLIVAGTAITLAGRRHASPSSAL